MTVVSKRNIDALQDANDFLHKADESIGAAFDFIEGMDASRGEKKEYAIGILEAWVKTKDALAKVRAALAEAKGGEE